MCWLNQGLADGFLPKDGSPFWTAVMEEGPQEEGWRVERVCSLPMFPLSLALLLSD